jgi:ureidoglycolate lyase
MSDSFDPAIIPTELSLERLSEERYSPYGNIIEGGAKKTFRAANFGRARRYDYLAAMHNLRPTTAKLNVCVFECSAFSDPLLNLNILERHAFSTQIFMPMAAGRYITIVATGGDAPDLSTLRAFIIDGPQGISYHPGVWHYPMTVLSEPLALSCMVYEDGSAEDCDVVTLPAPLVVHLEIPAR